MSCLNQLFRNMLLICLAITFVIFQTGAEAIIDTDGFKIDVEGTAIGARSTAGPLKGQSLPRLRLKHTLVDAETGTQTTISATPFTTVPLPGTLPIKLVTATTTVIATKGEGIQTALDPAATATDTDAGSITDLEPNPFATFFSLETASTDDGSDTVSATLTSTSDGASATATDTATATATATATDTNTDVMTGMVDSSTITFTVATSTTVDNNTSVCTPLPQPNITIPTIPTSTSEVSSMNVSTSTSTSTYLTFFTYTPPASPSPLSPSISSASASASSTSTSTSNAAMVIKVSTGLVAAVMLLVGGIWIV